MVNLIQKNKMSRLLLPAITYNPGDKKEVDCEKHIKNISFNIHRFTNRQVPENTANVVVFPNFSEFGSELIQTCYTMPRMLNSTYQGKYSIAMGWYGRAYLYKHLVDEFWEIKEEYQYLREYCRSFHHESKNLKNIEKMASQYGRVVAPNDHAIGILYPRLATCPVKECCGQMIHADKNQICLRCHAHMPPVGIYNDIVRAKTSAVWPNEPDKAKVDYVKQKYLKPRSVGITARQRTCYGRNLPADFYEKLVKYLESIGYNPIWIGEKETTSRSPFPHIVDYCTTEDARDLETTLALVSQLEFTIQFWTASTRLAGLVGTPYIIFESPDQLYGNGHEGYRLNLCTKKNNGKVVLAHYVNVASDHGAAIDLVGRAINEIAEGNFDDIIGMVESDHITDAMRKSNLVRIGKS
jgi:hypothetical protein